MCAEIFLLERPKVFPARVDSTYSSPYYEEIFMIDKINVFNSASVKRNELTRSAQPASPVENSLESKPVGGRNESLLSRAARANANTPEVQQSKVDDIKAAIRRGEFKVDSQAVAKAFLDMESYR